MNEHPADEVAPDELPADDVVAAAPEPAAVAPAVQPSADADRPVEADGDALEVAKRRLAEVADLPVEEHASVYEDVHSSLQEALAEAGREGEPGDDGAPDR
jgi:hypothetical protein